MGNFVQTGANSHAELQQEIFNGLAKRAATHFIVCHLIIPDCPANTRRWPNAGLSWSSVVDDGPASAQHWVISTDRVYCKQFYSEKHHFYSLQYIFTAET